MRVLFVFLGVLSGAGAVTTSPPEPDTLSDFCTEVTGAESIVSRAMLRKEKLAINF